MLIRYETDNLWVEEIPSNLSVSEKKALLPRINALLQPEVVVHLPEDFHNIHSESDAEAWLNTMLVQSRLMSLIHKHLGLVIGFLFAYPERDDTAHIGYLLGEKFWGQGYATELLEGFVEHVKDGAAWRKLVAGVAVSNRASSRLLQKIGFKV